LYGVDPFVQIDCYLCRAKEVVVDSQVAASSEGALTIAPTKTRLGRFAGAAAAMAGYKVRRGLGVSAGVLEQVAEKSWEIAPGVDEPHVPIYIAESHFGRILQASPPSQPIPELVAAIRSDRHQGGATRAFLLRDALLFRQHVYCGRYRGDLYSSLDWRTLWRAEMAEAAHSVLASTYSGARWFGHFLHDELPLQELVAGMGDGVGHVKRVYRHEPGWRAALGVAAPPSYAVLRARELIWIDDRGQNPTKRDRYQTMRSRLNQFPRGHDRVFLRRPLAGGEDRQIVNIAAVEQRLTREGFQVVDTGEVSVEEMLKCCLGASMVVSVEGSHAAPAYYFARRGGCVFFIYPPGRVSFLMPRLAGFYGEIGAMYVGQPVDASHTDFRVDPDDLVREIDRAAEFAARQSPL
jgi:hypothetical protein